MTVSFHFRKKNYSKIYIVAPILIGVAINVFVTKTVGESGLPLYLDVIGTILVTLLGGALPGVITAMLTRMVMSTIVEGFLYYAIIDVLIAILVAWYTRFSKHSKVVNFTLCIMIVSSICAVFGFVIQVLTVDLPKSSNFTEAASLVYDGEDVGSIILSLIFALLLNLVDKGFSFFIAFFIYKLIPQKLKKLIRSAGWKQTPLSTEEMQNAINKSGINTLLKKTTLWLSSLILILAVVFSWVSIALYYKDCIEEYTIAAQDTVRHAAEFVDGDKIDDYIKWGVRTKGYEETDRLLNILLNNTQGVESLSIVKVESNGYYCIFQEAKIDSEKKQLGILLPFEDDFEANLDTLKKGKDVGMINSHNDSGMWVSTASYAIKNSDGETVCYAVADIYLNNLSGYARDYLIKTLLCISGFVILALELCYTLTAYGIVFPISSITSAANVFIESHGNQRALDDNLKNTRRLGISTDDEIEELFTAVCTMESEMAEYVRELTHYAKTSAKMQAGLIITLADIVENRDRDSTYHLQKTAAYVRIILNGLRRKGYYLEKITDKFIEDVEMSAPLHDVGKIYIPDSILNKNGRYTDNEFEIMKQHATYGREILNNAINTIKGENYLKEARNMAAYHHERWDGKGYPEGLHGEVIPLSARVMALADTFDALTSDKAYKQAYTFDKALEILRYESGKQFDPKCVEAFLESQEEVKKVMKTFRNKE